MKVLEDIHFVYFLSLLREGLTAGYANFIRALYRRHAWAHPFVESIGTGGGEAWLGTDAAQFGVVSLRN